MTDFFHLNLPGYNVSDKDVSKILSAQASCISCKRENMNFISLSSCKHLFVFDFQYRFKIELETSMVCYQCHQFLKKICSFKEQFEENLIQLNEQVNYIRPTKTPFQSLKTSKTVITDIQNDLKTEYTESTSSPTDSNVNDYTEVTTDIKVEHESFSDNEIDIPLSEIKKETKVKKKKKTVKSKKKLPFKEKYDGKIAIVLLSTEEMMLERDREMKKESYLKFPFKCDSCITGFDHELPLRDHMQKRHNKKKGGFICKICNSVLGSEISFKEHTKRHTRRYECQECGKRYNNIYSVIKHYNELHGTISTEYTCTECGFTTESHRVLRYHRDKHKQKQKCPLCDNTFVNSASVRSHMLTVHRQSDRVFTCDKCGKQYRTKHGLKAHEQSRHGGAAGAFCPDCRQHFRTTQHLTHHLRTHSKHISDSDKRYICDECGARFLTKGPLQEHINFVHLKNTQHNCTKCDKVFSNHRSLKRHENYVHYKIRPPRNKICDHCGRGFTTLSILRAHVRTHTGERPLSCAYCPATFAHSAARYTHTKLLHRDRTQ